MIAGAGWFGYRFFSNKKHTGASGEIISAASFSANSCWVYHEYVYRVDFTDKSQPSFLFVRNADGTFSPSNADSAVNHIIGNGFIIDSTGACATSEKMAAPWELSDEEKEPLNDMMAAWLDLKQGLSGKEYKITGQTVALFVVLNDPKDFIEYNVSALVPGQKGYSLIYPSQKLLVKGLEAATSFSDNNSSGGLQTFEIIKTTFDKTDKEKPMALTSIDSITATVDNDGYFTKIQVIKGDEFFYEGSVVFDAQANCLGNLHYENNKWKLAPFTAFVQNPPAYTAIEPQQTWVYNLASQVWKKN
ncbi:MAG: hypothetical protein JWN76_2593 [Chitinophagaceae bacterium]|nr:hypothetical protein [Chitinophagaceae bacterium]